MQLSSSPGKWSSPARYGAPAAASPAVHSSSRVLRRRPVIDPAAQPLSDPGNAGAASLFRRHQALIEEVVRLVSRRGRLRREDADDFSGTVALRLLENDCAILRQFEGRSRLRTFLVRVIERMLLDCRIHEWGRWRPSARARRLGRVAILLEALTSRDGLSFGEATECLRTNHRLSVTVAELWELYTELPPRVRRRAVLISESQAVAAPLPQSELPSQAEVSRILFALRKAVGELGSENRVLLQHRFVTGLRIVRIAETCGYEQKELYRRFNSILVSLKRSMDGQGLAVVDIDGLIASLNCSPRPGPVLQFRE